MKKTLIAIGVLAAFTWALPAAMAQGVSVGGKAGVGLGVGVGGVGGSANVNANANAKADADSPKPSASAIENSNATFSGDRDLGRDRALERMSEQGLAHEGATEAAKKRADRKLNTPPRASVSTRIDGKVNR